LVGPLLVVGTPHIEIFIEDETTLHAGLEPQRGSSVDLTLKGARENTVNLIGAAIENLITKALPAPEEKPRGGPARQVGGGPDYRQGAHGTKTGE